MFILRLCIFLLVICVHSLFKYLPTSHLCSISVYVSSYLCRNRVQNQQERTIFSSKFSGYFPPMLPIVLNFIEKLEHWMKTLLMYLHSIEKTQKKNTSWNKYMYITVNQDGLQNWKIPPYNRITITFLNLKFKVEFNFVKTTFLKFALPGDRATLWWLPWRFPLV